MRGTGRRGRSLSISISFATFASIVFSVNSRKERALLLEPDPVLVAFIFVHFFRRRKAETFFGSSRSIRPYANESQLSLRGGSSRRSVSAAKARMSLAHPSSSSQTLYLLFQALQLLTQTPSTSSFLIFRSLSRGKSSSTQSLSLIWNLGTCGTLLVVGMTLGSSVPLSSGVLFVFDSIVSATIGGNTDGMNSSIDLESMIT